MLAEAIHYSRMAIGLGAFLRRPPLTDPEGMVRSQMEGRDARFLDTARRAIFSNPAHPYSEMFRLAGCEYGDLARGVERDGLEPTLAALNRQGVYLTHDEFKGKAPIVRSGKHIPAVTSDFRNPLVKGWMTGRSSGSRSKGTRTPTSTEYELYREAREALVRRELGVSGRLRAELKPILPSTSGLNSCLRGSRQGEPISRWFAVGGTMRDSGHYRYATRALVRLANLLGANVPPPTYLPPNDFSPVAEWISDQRAAGVACVVRGFTSPVVRAAAAAEARGLDIRGTVFMVGGEALTDAKRALVERTGAEIFPCYVMTEIGMIGYACRQMKTGNRVHLFRDGVAAINHRRTVPFSEVEVDALRFTTLLAFGPHILINAEMDDSGTIAPAHCDCAFSRVGFTDQIHSISSFGKLTGQGMTLVGTDIVRLLEEILPARLGGAPGDYQLVEQEGAAQTEMLLRVSPRATAAPAADIRECFLRELRQFYGGTLAVRMWSHAQSVRVLIGEPFTTQTGKVLSLHLLGPDMVKTGEA